jgi:hypothetical protein
MSRLEAFSDETFLANTQSQVNVPRIGMSEELMT